MSPRRPSSRAGWARFGGRLAAALLLAWVAWQPAFHRAYGQATSDDPSAPVAGAPDSSSPEGRLPAAILPDERPGYPGWTYRLRRRMMLGGLDVPLLVATVSETDGGTDAYGGAAEDEPTGTRFPMADLVPEDKAARRPGVAKEGEATSTEGQASSLLDIAAGMFSSPVSQSLRVLLLGSDRREGDAAWRTDTIILANLDPASRQVHLVSLPRDLWVFIPGHGYGRLNTADYLGHLDHLEEAEMVRRTLRANLDIPIDRYVLVDMAAFIAVVDALGGLELPVDCPIEDRLLENGPGRSADTPLAEGPVNERVLELDTGMHHLDGRGVLAYARTRTGSSDLVRTRHQQRVLRALTQRAKDGRIVMQLPQMWRAMQGRVRTDLSLGELLFGASVASGLSTGDLHTRVLGFTDLTDWTTPDGQQVLVLTPRGRATIAAALGGEPALKGRAATAAEDPASDRGPSPYANGGPYSGPYGDPFADPYGGPFDPYGAPFGSGSAFGGPSGNDGDPWRSAPSPSEPMLIPEPPAGRVAVRDASGHGDWGQVAAIKLQESGLNADASGNPASAVEDSRVLYRSGERALAEAAAAAIAIPALALEEATDSQAIPKGKALLVVVGADWQSCPGGRGH